MKSQIIVHGSRVHEVGFRLALLQYAKKYRFLNFEAFNDSNDNEEQVVIFVEGDATKITDLIEKIQINKPESAIVHGVTIEPYEGDILPLSSFSQDLQMEQMAKAVPILVEMRGMQKTTVDLQIKTLGLQEKTLGLQEKTLGLQQEAMGLHYQSISMHRDSLKKQDETIAEIRGLREDIHFTFSNRLTKIEESLQTIKSALEQAKILG